MAAGSGGLALTVHGPPGSVDLVVPFEASAADVAQEYARQARFGGVPDLVTRLGTSLPAGRPLVDLGVKSGDVLVCSTGPVPDQPSRQVAPAGDASVVEAGAASTAAASAWFGVAAAIAVLAGWYAAHAGPRPRDIAVLVLALAAAVGVVPVGRLAPARMTVAPAFGVAAAFAIAWDPHPARLPTILGVAALMGAVVAAVGRALDRRPEEGLRAWIFVGGGVFVVTTLAALLGLSEQVSWAVLLMLATLAARVLPGYAVDVPDDLLLDLERLSVSAWSARERPPGRRGRTLVPSAAVAAVASRGARIVTAYAVAVLVTAALSAPLLLRSATLPIDRVGARLLVLFAGGSLLLAARSYRHVAPRRLLRLAGLACWAALVVAQLPQASEHTATSVWVLAVVAAGTLVLVAVATGRGWRSAWWGRRAEIAEALCGAAALATLLVACGVFRTIWESIHFDV